MQPKQAVTAESILDTAAQIIERHGIDAFTMRGLADQLGVAVTSIYWHVGNKDALLDGLIARLVLDMAALPADADEPAGRIAALARAQRRALIDQQHVLGVAHARNQTRQLFRPVQRRLAVELATLDIVGADAALVLRAIEVHVISSAVMQFSAIRGGTRDEKDSDSWTDDWTDTALAQALQSPTDYDAVFEYGLAALLATFSQS